MSPNYQDKYANSWALVIGINSYLFTNPLAYACNDADAVAAILTNELGFSSENVTILKNGDATREAIMSAYLSYRNQADNIDDRILVFFAGHGTTIETLRGQIGYLVPVDGKPDDLSTLIRWDDLTRNADVIPAKHILFIIDACYSGLAAHRTLTPGSKRFVSDMLQRPARQVLTAGKADEVVADGGGPLGKNSIFTGYLIEGISGQASDAQGVLTANALMYYVYQKVSQDDRSNQSPHYGHIEGDGDFILKVPEGTDFLVKTLPEKTETIEIITLPKDKPSYADKANYTDPLSPNFGRNEWSAKLSEHRWGRDVKSDDVKAFSWLSLIIEPASNEPISIDIATQKERIPELKKPRPNEPPHEKYLIPVYSRTTINSLLFYDEENNNRDFWKGYIRLDKFGNLEYADSKAVFGEYSGIRHFRYVQIIGTIWQFLFFAKEILTSAGYEKGVRLLVNLVGTKDTILADFSTERSEGKQPWLDPFTPGGYGREGHLFDLKCPDQNLQIESYLVIGMLDNNMAIQVVEDVARQLALAYNHGPTLRCFNHDSMDFPWNQYFYVRNNWR